MSSIVCHLLSLSSVVVVVAISTCYPPHEQLLMRLGVGGVLFITGGGHGAHLGCCHLFWGAMGGSM